MVVGEPSLMGGEFGEEDERLISRLENAQYDPAAQAAQAAAQGPPVPGQGPPPPGPPPMMDDPNSLGGPPPGGPPGIWPPPGPGGPPLPPSGGPPSGLKLEPDLKKSPNH